ncbi:MAG TPA: CapA family protein [Burkholderiales bacterium]|jgi:poly-gamma-glutamate synthesis protein (capsule biosynthesis protein)
MDAIGLFLCGDVMTGRGIDQILATPGDPALHEGYLESAEEYVALAEIRNGPIPRPVAESYVWGDAFAELDRVRPDLRIVNLETAVTLSDEWAPKGINYRMHPANVSCLTAAAIDCCVLANNHVLDWGEPGLIETLETLERSGIRVAGAGRNRGAAEAPAVLPLRDNGRVLVFSMGMASSGVSPDWAAGAARPGVDFLPDLSQRSVEGIARRVEAVKRPGDVIVLSIHWGANWGYEVADDERAFAQALIDSAGVDLVHGHSSHHPKGIEIHRGRLILYGCGDFINDYEGIRGHEAFRGDLGLMYFPVLESGTGRLARLAMTATQVKRFQVRRASGADARWLAAMLDREGRRLGTRSELLPDGRIELQWGPDGPGVRTSQRPSA